MSFDLEETRRQLIAMRVKFGAESEDGKTCSTLIEQLKNYEKAPPPVKARLDKLIKESMARLSRQKE